MDLTKNNGNKQELLLPKEWQRLSEWIHCICVVTFDLELGQAMEVWMNYKSFWEKNEYKVKIRNKTKQEQKKNIEKKSN